MNLQEIMELQAALATIPTTGTHTITMANCLQLLEEKITEAIQKEKAEKAEKASDQEDCEK